MSPRRNRRLVLLAFVGVAIAVTSAQSTRPSALRDISLEDALRLAAVESKVVLASFGAEWDASSAELDRTVWSNPRLRLLTDARTIAIRIDADRSPELAERCAVQTIPTVVLLNANGEVLDRIAGFRRAPEMLSELDAALAGKNALQRAREGVERTAGRSPTERERLAEALAADGQHAAALTNYLWCFDEGLKQHVLYASVRRDALAVAISRLGKLHSPAIAALQQRRDDREAAILSGADDANLAHELAALNASLEEHSRTLAIRDRLDRSRRVHGILLPYVFDLLVEARRYAELLEGTDPVPFFSESARIARMQRAPCCAVHYRGGRFVGETVVERGGKLLEALAGERREAEARRMIDAVLEYQDTAEHRALLEKHLRRAEANVLADELAARPPAPSASP